MNWVIRVFARLSCIFFGHELIGVGRNKHGKRVNFCVYCEYEKRT